MCNGLAIVRGYRLRRYNVTMGKPALIKALWNFLSNVAMDVPFFFLQYAVLAAYYATF
jgi:hypothetical protein